MTEHRILLLFFHPRFENSNVHKKLLQAASTLSTITIRDMYEIYPDYNIDIKAEQAILLEHDIIIWQHPFYWYSCPPLMKQWIDLVLEHGWAYGRTGNMLKGKCVMNVLSSGGKFESYQENGKNRFTFRELLSPFDQTAFLCYMDYLPPFIVSGAHQITDESLEEYSIRYIEVLNFLQSTDWDIQKLTSIQHFNDLNFEIWQEKFYKTV
ncbi:NAD(P)H-dependent oxidoreductase [Flectobacillus major]|jgi:glutathione-regulated potassium-efflux system ancillary protein KefG|uniref:NAD(P)H-dependent oxidoreductase n=1 Tax=Flectobacillus major TaxID=103 RepID=UPI0004230A17|nr:NAD(P)H-dependent oxidoreductase [Flectobacillus major]